jgi:peptidoglycan/xylan/chitin deacetylase (PgdA/CDA1 family)
MHASATTPQVGSRRTALNAAAGALWHVPGSFKFARVLGPQYSLRCVVFHDVSDVESVFTKGLGGTITRKNFEAALKFLTKHYTPVSLQDVLASFDGQGLPPRPVLVTFDDAYASVCEVAAPLCSKFRVPAVFFVNAASLDNRQLALDNLVCYVANTFGVETINAAIHTVNGCEDCEVRTLAEVFARFLPGISLSARRVFRDSLVQLARVSESDLAAEANLHLTSQQLRQVTAFDFDIGDHTYTHVNCRVLTDDFAEEIDQNRAILELVSGKKVRSFSVPYGSSSDLTGSLLSHLQKSGYEAIFLAEGRANSVHTDQFRLNRISINTGSDSALFSEIEVLPRLRAIRNVLLATTNSAHPWRDSGLKKVNRTNWLSREDIGTDAAAPSRNPGPE